MKLPEWAAAAVGSQRRQLCALWARGVARERLPDTKIHHCLLLLQLIQPDWTDRRYLCGRALSLSRRRHVSEPCAQTQSQACARLLFSSLALQQHTSVAFTSELSRGLSPKALSSTDTSYMLQVFHARSSITRDSQVILVFVVRRCSVWDVVGVQHLFGWELPS